MTSYVLGYRTRVLRDVLLPQRGKDLIYLISFSFPFLSFLCKCPCFCIFKDFTSYPSSTLIHLFLQKGHPTHFVDQKYLMQYQLRQYLLPHHCPQPSLCFYCLALPAQLFVELCSEIPLGEKNINRISQTLIKKKKKFQVICLLYSAVPGLASWYYCIAVTYSTAVEINGRASVNKFMEGHGLAWGSAQDDISVRASCLRPRPEDNTVLSLLETKVAYFQKRSLWGNCRCC